MKRVSKISSGQLVSLLLAGRLSNCLLFSSDSFEQFTLWECIASMALNGVLILLVLLPTVLWLRRGTLEGAFTASPAEGRCLALCYLLLCFFVLSIDIIQFSDFALKTMKAEFSVPVLTAVFIAVSLVAAFYGIEALARAALPVAVFSGLCLIVFSAALLSEMQLLHFPPSSAGSLQRIFGKAISDLPRTAEVFAIGLLFPYINGSVLKGGAWFAGITACFSALAGVTAVGVLGDYAAQTAYPYYAAVTAAQIGVFQRLDILVTAVWLGTFFVRFSLFSRLLLDCGKRVFGKRAIPFVGGGAFILLLLLAFWMQSGSYRGQWTVVTQLYWWALALFCVVLPFLLKRRKRHEAG